ncbi:MAG: hypothetical protein ACQEVA_10095 [Myxococcota bacterium]
MKFYAAFVPLLIILAFSSACQPDIDEPDEPGPPEPVPFSTTEDELTVRTGDSYEPIFLKGVNLGVSVPGTLPGELAATREQYASWFDQMSEIGMNVVRVYTLHYPRFYEELARHNRERPDDPLYVMHGVWLLEDNPTGDLVEMTEVFDDDIREVVDCVHGSRSIDARFGQAFGEYDTDISQWVIGWIIGREIAPNEVLITDSANPDATSFDGDHLRVADANPTTAWLTERLDLLIGYERENYGQERPVSVANWPTLDPLDHPVEGDRYSDEDVASFDLSRVETVDAPGGIFATYHAYPYYPDFVSDTPDYREFEGTEGPIAYLGYLMDLREHYAGMPLFIGEFGVPSSWGNAHHGYEDLDHGGYTEVGQGAANARLIRAIHSAGTAGGALFAWIDEWWKPTWITDQRDLPRDRRHLWHNRTAPEQNFGLIDYHVTPPDFESASADAPGDAASGIEQVRAVADAAYFRVQIRFDEPFEDGDAAVVAFDTYGDDLGETQLPNGVVTQRRQEFAAVLDGWADGELMVTQAYDTVRIWHGSAPPEQEFRSVASDGAPWHRVRWFNSQFHGSNDGTYEFEEEFDEDIGRLPVRVGDEEPTSRDAVIIDGRFMEIRLPWTLLNVTDPSSRRVLHDDRSTQPRETRQTDGIAVSVVLNGQVAIESRRFSWSMWDEAPPTIAREKPSLQMYGQAIEGLSAQSQ